MSAVAVPPADVSDVSLARKALVWLWVSLGFAVLAFGVGANWDRAWHGTHPFEQFWSPPHLFIYAMTIAGALAFLKVFIDRNLREQFGPGFRLPTVPFAVPPSLLFAGCGYAALGLAGALDNVWHSKFGLDETAWSLPHAALGWGVLTVLAGLFSCHLALADRVRVRWYTRLIFSWIFLGILVERATGPFGSATIPAIQRKIAALPVLQIPPTEHLFRIDAMWNLNHTNPIFLLLAALGVGMGLAVVREIDWRDWYLAALALAVTLATMLDERRLALRLGVIGDPSAWLPTPIVVAAILFLVAMRFGLNQRVAWAIAGAGFGLFVCLFWHIPAGWIVPGAVAMPIGAILGGHVIRVIAKPTGPTVLRFVAIANLGIPIAVGCIDLFLRWSTP